MTIHRSGAAPEELVAQWRVAAPPSKPKKSCCLRAGGRLVPLVPWHDSLAVARVLDRWLAGVGDHAAEGAVIGG